jgi:hypothetical protein
MYAQTNVGLLSCVGSAPMLPQAKKKGYDKQEKVRADKQLTPAAVP